MIEVVGNAWRISRFSSPLRSCAIAYDQEEMAKSGKGAGEAGKQGGSGAGDKARGRWSSVATEVTATCIPGPEHL